jgi:hypothetical protein
MGTIRPQQNPNILDIALQEYESMEAVFDDFEDDDIFDITTDISECEDLKVGREAFKKDIVEYYKSRSKNPDNGISDEENALLGGFSEIDYLALDDDFIIY